MPTTLSAPNATPAKTRLTKAGKPRQSHVKGTVYLLHFNEPYEHAKHYVGWTSNLEERLAHHANGDGSKLLAVLKEHGIGWQLARTWTNVDRFFERRVKNHSATRYCPICRGEIALRSLSEGSL